MRATDPCCAEAAGRRVWHDRRPHVYARLDQLSGHQQTRLRGTQTMAGLHQLETLAQAAGRCNREIRLPEPGRFFVYRAGRRTAEGVVAASARKVIEFSSTSQRTSMRSGDFYVRIHGAMACFSRPEFSTERVSYDLITPSAARGVLEAVLWKPAIRWQIRSIALLSRVQWTQFRRNEVNSRVSTRNALSAATGGASMPDFYADEDRAQRNTLALRDVDYGIVARFEMTGKAGPADNLRKFEEMFERRLERGQQHFQPYLGCREFPAWVEGWDGTGALESETRDLGWMLHDIDFGAMREGTVLNEAYFFSAALHQGVVDVPERRA